MDTEIKTPEQTEPVDLQTELDSLRHFVLSVLILLIVISGTLNIYMYYQFKSVGRDLDSVRPLVANLRNSYYKGDGPAIERFVKDCMEYGKTHPDFAPYLDKYGLRPPPGAPAPVTAPVAAPPGGAIPTPGKK
jgi:hypothetical protein